MMKGKLGRLIILGILVALCLGNFILGIKLNYPPYENELVTLINTRLTFNNLGLDQQSRATILNNILGEEQYFSEKIFPLRSWLQALGGTKGIFNLRLVNFIIFIMTLILFYFFLKQVGWTSPITLFPLISITISPLSLSLWLFRPKICLTIFLLISWLLIWSRKERKFIHDIFWVINTLLLFYSSFQGLIIGLLLLTPITLFRFYRAKKYSIFLTLAILVLFLIIPIIKNPLFKKSLTQSAPFNAVNPTQVGQQITERFTQEDGLQVRVIFPLLFRRMGYNKIFFAYRNFTKEVLNFFDLETLFFQEVHPMQQKSEVTFYWPEIFVFLVGIFWFIKSGFGKKQKNLLFLIFLSFIFHLFTQNDTFAGRYALTLFTLAIVIGIGFKQMPRGLSLIILPLIIWAIYINTYDILKRPLFWYDNRPYVYAQGIKAIKMIETESVSYKNIYLTSLVGNPKIYYFYYFSPQPELFLKDPLFIEDKGKIVYFNSFDLVSNLPQKNSLYFGFLGEFIGPNSLNEFSEQDINKIEPIGLKIEKVWKLDNTIAFRYSDYFVLASLKE
ncbi:hypothetical protein KKI19_00695 [Patescibacteria group bacterium]|nr:hypothetical protein [Patescibacteria group bacterium]